MRDVKESLFPHETVQYQYNYPLWMKLLAGAALLVVGYTLYDDFIAGRTVFVMVEVVMLGYMVYWLVMMQRDSGQYVLTNLRVLRLGNTPADDQVIEYPQISEVHVLKDSFSGSRLVQVKSMDQREIRIPIPGMGQAKSVEMAQMINQLRGFDPAELPAAGTPEKK